MCPRMETALVYFNKSLISITFLKALFDLEKVERCCRLLWLLFLLAHLSEAQGEVLVSYFVRRPSVRPQLFKRLFLLYYLVNFKETLQE